MTILEDLSTVENFTLGGTIRVSSLPRLLVDHKGTFFTFVRPDMNLVVEPEDHVRGNVGIFLLKLQTIIKVLQFEDDLKKNYSRRGSSRCARRAIFIPYLLGIEIV